MLKEIAMLAKILLACCLPAAVQPPVGAYDKHDTARPLVDGCRRGRPVHVYAV